MKKSRDKRDSKDSKDSKDRKSSKSETREKKDRRDSKASQSDTAQKRDRSLERNDSKSNIFGKNSKQDNNPKGKRTPERRDSKNKKSDTNQSSDHSPGKRHSRASTSEDSKQDAANRPSTSTDNRRLSDDSPKFKVDFIENDADSVSSDKVSVGTAEDMITDTLETGFTRTNERKATMYPTFNDPPPQDPVITDEKLFSAAQNIIANTLETAVAVNQDRKTTINPTFKDVNDKDKNQVKEEFLQETARALIKHCVETAVDMLQSRSSVAHAPLITLTDTHRRTSLPIPYLAGVDINNTPGLEETLEEEWISPSVSRQQSGEGVSTSHSDDRIQETARDIVGSVYDEVHSLHKSVSEERQEVAKCLVNHAILCSFLAIRDSQETSDTFHSLPSSETDVSQGSLLFDISQGRDHFVTEDVEQAAKVHQDHFQHAKGHQDHFLHAKGLPKSIPRTQAASSPKHGVDETDPIHKDVRAIHTPGSRSKAARTNQDKSTLQPALLSGSPGMPSPNSRPPSYQKDKANQSHDYDVPSHMKQLNSFLPDIYNFRRPSNDVSCSSSVNTPHKSTKLSRPAPFKPYHTRSSYSNIPGDWRLPHIRYNKLPTKVPTKCTVVHKDKPDHPITETYLCPPAPRWPLPRLMTNSFAKLSRYYNEYSCSWVQWASKKKVTAAG